MQKLWVNAFEQAQDFKPGWKPPLLHFPCLVNLKSVILFSGIQNLFFLKYFIPYQNELYL